MSNGPTRQIVPSGPRPPPECQPDGLQPPRPAVDGVAHLRPEGTRGPDDLADLWRDLGGGD
jgi:hypothetical protein